MAKIRRTCRVQHRRAVALRARPSLRSAKPLVQWLRSGLMIVTTGFNFVALRYLQLDQTVTKFFLTPLIVAALAGPLLDEWIGWHRMVAVVAGFLGVLFVMHPDFGSLHWAMLLALVATFGYALYNLATRYLAAFDPARVTQTNTPLAGFLVMAPFAFAEWQWTQDLRLSGCRPPAFSSSATSPLRGRSRARQSSSCQGSICSRASGR